MDAVTGVEPITETDDEIRSALEQAELPPLLPALAYLTGDLSLLRDELRPDPLLIGMPQGGLTDEQQAAARDARARRARRASATAAASPRRRPPTTSCSQIMEFAVGGADMAAYLPLLEEELAFRGEDRRRARRGTRTTSRPTPTSASSIIGAGHVGPARRRTGCSRPACRS